MSATWLLLDDIGDVNLDLLGRNEPSSGEPFAAALTP